MSTDHVRNKMTRVLEQARSDNPRHADALTLSRVGYLRETDREVRRVSTPDAHVGWQRTRYESGTFFALTEADYARLAKHLGIRETQS